MVRAIMPLLRWLPGGVPMRIVLLAIAVLATLPTLVFSGLLLLRYAESERARAEAALVDSARGIARAIDAEFSAAEAALMALRTSGFLEADNLAAFEARLRRASAETGRLFVLIDRTGQQRINTMLPPGAELPRGDSHAWAPVFDEGRRHITDVIAGAASRLLLAGIGVPVSRGGRVEWVLTTGLFPKDFARVIAEPGVPRDWIVSIVDHKGMHLVRSHRDEDFAGKPLVEPLIGLLQRGERAVIRTTSLEGIKLISTVAVAPMSGWAAAVGLPVTALEVPMWQALRDMALIGLAFAACALALAFVVARYLDRAMAHLTQAAESIGRGHLGSPPPSSVREINAVGRVLTDGARRLHDLTASLESQVAARTRELTEANRQLGEEIRRREASETQIRQMQKIEAIGQLTGGIAHDFNNMLAVVLGSLRLIERRLERGDANVQKFIDGAVQGAERAASLTRRLLAFSRQQALAPQTVDANKLVAGMGEILRRTIPETVQIETVLAGGLWRSHVDAQGLESAIINLAVNARDAMPEGGKLTIETANAHLDEAYVAGHSEVTAGQYVMIAVTDTGEGMPQEIVARAFDPFFTTKPTGHGTGLGLSQVYGFIKQSGGHVKIYSEPGVGTTVKLYLPRLHGEGETAGAPARAEASLAGARNGETVLVVEDEPEVRRLTAEMLRELGYRTLEAEGGAAALRLLDAHPEVALLLTDVVMPEMNGRQLADAVLKHRPGLPVLFTTGYTRNAIVHRGVLDPGVHLLTKPHTLEGLAQKLEELLRPARS